MTKYLDLVQGSQEWVNFRRDKIGASDAPIIMGLSPWKSPEKLFDEKINGTTDFVNEAMRDGIRLEPIARKMFSEAMGISFEPIVAVSEERPWQIASLDGISHDRNAIVEIKCGKRDLYEKAVKGVIPVYYLCQIQHHMNVTGLDHAYYCCFYEGAIEIIKVAADPIFIKDLIQKEEKFYHNMLSKEPPTPSEPAYEIRESEEDSKKLDAYFTIFQQIKELTELKDTIKRELVEKTTDNFILNGVKIYQTQTTSYDTKAMLADGMDLEPYKKQSKPFWMISSRK